MTPVDIVLASAIPIVIAVAFVVGQRIRGGASVRTYLAQRRQERELEILRAELRAAKERLARSERR